MNPVPGAGRGEARGAGPRRWPRRAILVATSSTLALLAAEGAYRATRVSGLSPTTHPAYVAHDPELGWCYRPNARARHTSPEFDVEVAINSDGFRGPEWPAARDARPLVLIVGDSIVFGWGVEEDESCTGRLRRAHPEWDVRGAGLSGTAPDQQLLLLRRLAQRLRPDVVVCVSSLNDAYEAHGDVAYGLRKPRFVLVDGRPDLVSLPGPEPWLHAHSLLWRALTKLVWRWEFSRQQPTEDWPLVVALYGAMLEVWDGAQFVLVGARPELAAAAAAHSRMRYVDLTSALPPGGDWIFPIDTHWNAAGHGRVAEVLAAQIAAALAARGR